MSPTSRWSRNCTPLTTRPSRTSRQGMILRAGKVERLLEPDLAFPQRLADDRAGRGQAAKVVERGNAARGLNGELRQPLDRLAQQLDVGAGHHPVAADVG